MKNTLKDKLNGLGISLVDEEIIEDLGFSDDFVIATIGIKGEAICGPVLDYEITGDDSLVIDQENFNIRWDQIKIFDDSIVVMRNNVSARYKITFRPSLSKRKLP